MTISRIFVAGTFKEADDLPWEDAEGRTQKAVELFKNVFNFVDVKVFKDAKKSEIIKEMKALQKISDDFEKTSNGEHKLVINVLSLPVRHTVQAV